MPRGTINKKIKAIDLFNCADLSSFIASIVQVMPYRGVSMSRFYLCELEGIRFLTKMCFYHKTSIEIYGDVPGNVIPHIDAELNILRILNSKIVSKNISPCIIELVYSTTCEGISKVAPKDTVCDKLFIEDRIATPDEDIAQHLCRYKDLIKNGLAHDKCAFLVLDMCDMSLEDYLYKGTTAAINAAIFKSLLFQIVYTVFAITRLYPKFRHYDLHTENIMLKFDPEYKFKANDPRFLVFTVDGAKYTVPYFGIIPKIIDFGFSSLPEEGIVSNATEDKHRMYGRAQNDLLFLFHWIHHRLRYADSSKQSIINNILKALEPNGTYIQYHTEYIRKVADSIPTYEQMVKNHIWDEYRRHEVPKKQVYNEFAQVTRAA